MDYKIYHLNYVKKNHSLLVNECLLASKFIETTLNTDDTTWAYLHYNLFSITTASTLFYNLLKETKNLIKDFIKNDNPIWIQAWLNYHNSSEVEDKLKSHGHETRYHGYICIDPQHTHTIFKKGFHVENTPGLVYMGPGSNSNEKDDTYNHYVKTITPTDKPRITIGFNFSDIPNFRGAFNSWIPLV